MEEILVGQVASGIGKINGKVKKISEPEQSIGSEEIMVIEITNPQFFSQMDKCKAIVTDLGGLLCHTSILARELGKPCIVGTEKATEKLNDGDVILLDLDNGKIFRV